MVWQCFFENEVLGGDLCGSQPVTYKLDGVQIVEVVVENCGCQVSIEFGWGKILQSFGFLCKMGDGVGFAQRWLARFDFVEDVIHVGRTASLRHWEDV